MDIQPSRQKVLIVDDAPADIRILGEELKSSYEVIVATDGETALKRALSENAPDLILLDIMMPDPDGYEVCRRLKANEATRDIPVIFITAMNGEDDEKKGLELGAVDYICKPFSVPIVLARVNTHLELKRKTDLLENLSYLDGLTGIANRRRFDDVLKAEWNRARRKASLLSIIMIDIDYFKSFNDTYGHHRGDECLKELAGVLSGCLRRSPDFVARYGGEEFAAILPETDLAHVVAIAETIRKSVEDLDIEHSGSPLRRVTASFGVASMAPTPASSTATLLEAADQALYRAKSNGRNQVRSAG